MSGEWIKLIPSSDLEIYVVNDQFRCAVTKNSNGTWRAEKYWTEDIKHFNTREEAKAFYI